LATNIGLGRPAVVKIPSVVVRSYYDKTSAVEPMRTLVEKIREGEYDVFDMGYARTPWTHRFAAIFRSPRV
jgi:hypothetical protein